MPDEWVDEELEICRCMVCKGEFAVPYHEVLPDIGHPNYCPFCGLEFDVIYQEDEDV